MATTLRILISVFSIFLIGSYLCNSIGLIGGRPIRGITHTPPLLLTTIITFVILETFLIGFLMFQRRESAAGRPRQFSIGALLIATCVIAIPLAMAPIYESVLASMPTHPSGKRGLSNWLFIGIIYFMLLPITYLCYSGKQIIQMIIQEKRSSSTD
ncbi:MAG: hypothetical protein MK108_10700 [Mariniblastus sp.]|nr:hypothetical protein [Mariniblastus sp.]